MMRWCFHIFAAVSLLLLFVAIASWVDSHTHVAWLNFYGSAGELRFGQEMGSVMVQAATAPADAAANRRPLWRRFPVPPHLVQRGQDWMVQTSHGAPGFGWTVRRKPGSPALLVVVLRHWLIVTLAAVAPLAWLVMMVRRRRFRAPHLCDTCGYNLHGTLHAGGTMCPECGAAIEGAANGASKTPPAVPHSAGGA